MTRRFWINTAQNLPLLAFTMVEMSSGQPMGFSSNAQSIWLQFVLAAPVVLWGGWPFCERGWVSIAARPAHSC
jgi:P-type Cu+ transporter